MFYMNGDGGLVMFIFLGVKRRASPKWPNGLLGFLSLPCQAGAHPSTLGIYSQ